MTSLRETLRRFFAPPAPLPAGVYPYQSPPDAPVPYRLHLRLAADGQGMLIVNAATVLHLNPTAAEYAYHFVQGARREQAARAVAARYRIGLERAWEDYTRFCEQIETLVTTPDLDPQTFFGFERAAPYSALDAPLRLDCALTYCLPEGANPQAAPRQRAATELQTGEWKSILDQAWQAGVPHVIFTGGEPTLRADLPELIRHAEQNGQVSGLLSDGLRLQDPAYLETLLQTGLDHLLFLLDPQNEHSWAALQCALAADLFVTVHLTLDEHSAPQAGATLARLAELGVKTVSLSAPNKSWQSALQAAYDRAAMLGLKLVWDLPTPYSAFNPVALETEAESGGAEGDAQSSGAQSSGATAWLYVEPDGDALRGQGDGGGALGNLLRDGWEKVWAVARGE